MAIITSSSTTSTLRFVAAFIFHLPGRTTGRRMSLGRTSSSTSGPFLLPREESMLDPVAGLEAEAAGGPGDDFQHGPDRKARGNRPCRQRLGLVLDAVDRPVRLDEDHV